MPAAGSVSETALVVIAIAVAIQSAVMLAAIIGAIVIGRRMQAGIDRRYEALAAKLDDGLVQARLAVQAVNRVSDRASDVMGEAGDAVRNLASAATAPRSLLMAGAASAAGGLLARWRRRRSNDVT